MAIHRMTNSMLCRTTDGDVVRRAVAHTELCADGRIRQYPELGRYETLVVAPGDRLTTIVSLVAPVDLTGFRYTYVDQ